MRLAPVVVATHASGPEAWEEAISAVADCLDRHRDASVALRLPGVAVSLILAGAAAPQNGEFEVWEFNRLDRLGGHSTRLWETLA